MIFLRHLSTTWAYIFKNQCSLTKIFFCIQSKQNPIKSLLILSTNRSSFIKCMRPICAHVLNQSNRMRVCLECTIAKYSKTNKIRKPFWWGWTVNWINYFSNDIHLKYFAVALYIFCGMKEVPCLYVGIGKHKHQIRSIA